jgi:hypothetical protein
MKIVIGILGILGTQYVIQSSSGVENKIIFGTNPFLDIIGE